MADGTLTARAGSLGGASMRYHELALQRWLNSWAIVREGYPVPVVYTSPMDAFAHFRELWAQANNPFEYLLTLKDSTGRSLYEPHPSPMRYPVISVHRRGWNYRTSQNFSIHRWRHLNWPTVSDDGPPIPGKEQIGTGLTRRDLGEVMTARRPMAWDYRFQIDHFCNRPDTQAFFIDQFMQQMWRTGGVPQTWITVPYPGYGDMLVRLYLEGNIENMTPEEVPEGRYVEFRTTISVVLEGFDVDLRYKVFPALWNVVIGSGSVDPETLQVAFTEDLRENAANPTLDSRTPPPSTETEATWRREREVELVTLDVSDSWSTAGVLFTASFDASADWDVEQNSPVEVDAAAAWDVALNTEIVSDDAEAVWDVESDIGPWTPSLFAVDTRNANGMGSWGPGMDSGNGQLWVAHDSPQSTGYYGGKQVGYAVLPNDDLQEASGSSTTPFDNYLTCLWFDPTQEMYTRRRNFLTIFNPDGTQSFPEIALGINPSPGCWGMTCNSTHIFGARGQGGTGAVYKVDANTRTIIAETSSVAGLALIAGGVIYVADTDRVYACGSQAGSKIACIDPATCSITGYIDDSAISGQQYLRLAYCTATQRLFATTSNQSKIYVFALTGGSDGVGVWEATIDTGTSLMYPIIYDAEFERIITAEYNGVGNGRLLVIDPQTLTFERDVTHPEIQASWDLHILPNGVCYLFQNYPGKIVRFART